MKITAIMQKTMEWKLSTPATYLLVMKAKAYQLVNAT